MNESINSIRTLLMAPINFGCFVKTKPLYLNFDNPTQILYLLNGTFGATFFLSIFNIVLARGVYRKLYPILLMIVAGVIVCSLNPHQFARFQGKPVSSPPIVHQI